MPFARLFDRKTSHEAAESVIHLSETKKSILAVLKTKPMTDEELVKAYQDLAHRGKFVYASDSGIRSRRSELVSAGLIKEVGFDKTRSGRRTTIWSVV